MFDCSPSLNRVWGDIGEDLDLMTHNLDLWSGVRPFHDFLLNIIIVWQGPVGPIKIQFVGSDVWNKTLNEGVHCFQYIRNGLGQAPDSKVEQSRPILKVVNFGHDPSNSNVNLGHGLCSG